MFSITGPLLDNDIAQLLLKEIVQLWLNIRGFSAAGSFVERFKQSHSEGSWTQERLKRKKLDMDKADEKWACMHGVTIATYTELANTFYN